MLRLIQAEKKVARVDQFSKRPIAAVDCLDECGGFFKLRWCQLAKKENRVGEKLQAQVKKKKKKSHYGAAVSLRRFCIL